MGTRFRLVAIAGLFLVPAAFAQLPDGPGKDVLQKVCGSCHEPDVVSQYRKSSKDWTDMISRMIEQGAEGTDEQFNTILAYLVKNFGPQVNVNKAAAADLESQLEITAKEAEAIVKYRTDKGNFKELDDLKKVPDLDFKKIEAKKDKIAF